MSMEEMEAATLETVRQNGLRDGYIRLLVTRGKGNLGLSPDRCPKASVIIIAATIQLYPPEAYERRSEEHTSELQSPDHLVSRLLLEKKKNLHHLLTYNPP